MENDEIFRTLNDLIATCQDGEAGFLEAAEGTRDARTRDVFLEHARARGRFANELRVLAAEAGMRPRKSGPMTGALHRGWIHLREAVEGHDEGAIIAEVEHGEDAALEAYRRALGQDLPPGAREAADRQYRQVLQAREQIRSMELRAHGGRMPRNQDY